MTGSTDIFCASKDDGPIPTTAASLVRRCAMGGHGGDVVQAIARLAESEDGKGSAYNIGQDETLLLVEFLESLAATMHCPLKTVRVPREEARSRQRLVAILALIQR